MNDEKVVISHNIWRFNTQDYSVIGALILSVVVLLSLIYLSFGGDISVSGKKIGKIVVKKNIVQRKSHGDLIWTFTNNQYPAYEKDTIRVGKTSSALLILDKDKAEIDMDENTMVVLDFLASEETSRIKFEYGSLRVKQAKPKEGESALKPIQLQFKDEELKLEGGDVRLSGDKSKEELNVVVVKGESKITTQSGEESILTQNEALSLKKGEIKKQSISLLAKTPFDGERLFTVGKRAKVKFSWAASDDAGKIFVEVSQSSDFSTKKGKFIRKRAKGSSLALTLGEGTYYWRISGQTGAGSQAQYSIKRKLTVVSKGVISAHKPASGYKFSYQTKPPSIDFSWSRNEYADGYNLEIAEDPKFTKVIRKESTSSASYSAVLSEGRYYWRVSTQSVFAQARITGKTESFQIVHDKVSKLSRIRTYNPAPKTIFSQTKAEKQGYTFNWQGHPEVSRMRFIIAKNTSLKNMVVNEEVKNNFYTLKRELAGGVYYWKVQSANDGEKKINAQSAIQTFRVKADKVKADKKEQEKEDTQEAAPKEEVKKLTIDDIRRKYGKLNRVVTKSGRVLIGSFKQDGQTIYMQTVDGRVVLTTKDIRKMTSY